MSALSHAIEDDVERARLGDQLAAARIAEVGRMFRANEGGAQIKATYAAILAYVDKNPGNDDPGTPIGKGIQIGHDARLVLRQMGAGFGADSGLLLTALPMVGGRRAMTAAIVTIAKNPLPANAIALASRVYTSKPAHDTFLSAANDPISFPLSSVSEDMQQYAAAGHILGYAIRLQAIRQGAPIHIFSPDMAWELGY
jgi:hypothetical protein